jgi:hypothetical protein
MAYSDSESQLLKFMNLFGQLVGLLGRGISPTQGLYLHRTTQHRKKKNADIHIHASSGIRTHDPSVQAVEDSTCLRQRDHWSRAVPLILRSDSGATFH